MKPTIVPITIPAIVPFDKWWSDKDDDELPLSDSTDGFNDDGATLTSDGMNVGSTVGSWVNVGTNVGSTDGSWVNVGTNVGSTDGSWVNVGMNVGSADGSWVNVGVNVGSADGSWVNVGSTDGSWVNVGSTDGSTVGSDIGLRVGNIKGANVGNIKGANDGRMNVGWTDGSWVDGMNVGSTDGSCVNLGSWVNVGTIVWSDCGMNVGSANGDGSLRTISSSSILWTLIISVVVLCNESIFALEVTWTLKKQLMMVMVIIRYILNELNLILFLKLCWWIITLVSTNWLMIKLTLLIAAHYTEYHILEAHI